MTSNQNQFKVVQYYLNVLPILKRIYPKEEKENAYLLFISIPKTKMKKRIKVIAPTFFQSSTLNEMLIANKITSL